MARRGKSLEVTDALIEDILGLAYSKGRTWAVLATLFDHVDTRMQYHEDHVFPKSQLDARALKAAKHDDGSRRYSDDAIDQLVSRRDLLPNLELLPGPENIGKSDTAPDVWTVDHYPGADEYAAFLKANALPEALPHSVDDFLTFYDARRELLIARIKEKLRHSGRHSPTRRGPRFDRHRRSARRRRPRRLTDSTGRLRFRSGAEAVRRPGTVERPLRLPEPDRLLCSACAPSREETSDARRVSDVRLRRGRLHHL